MQVRRKIRIAIALAVSGACLGLASPAAAQNQAGDSLVNVQVGDVTVQLPVALAANVCDVNVNVLARQLRNGSATCEADAESAATPGPPGPGGGGNQAGDSLVNVQIGDVTVQLPIGIAANVCDVNANVLAQQARAGDAECTAVADSTAG